MQHHRSWTVNESQFADPYSATALENIILGNFGKQPQSDEDEKSRSWMEPQGGHFENVFTPQKTVIRKEGLRSWIYPLAFWCGFVLAWVWPCMFYSNFLLHPRRTNLQNRENRLFESLTLLTSVTEIYTYLIYLFATWVICGERDFHTFLLSIYEFYKNRLSESRNFLTGLNGN
jgi:hypothetical protein